MPHCHQRESARSKPRAQPAVHPRSLHSKTCDALPPGASRSPVRVPFDPRYRRLSTRRSPPTEDRIQETPVTGTDSVAEHGKQTASATDLPPAPMTPTSVCSPRRFRCPQRPRSSHGSNRSRLPMRHRSDPLYNQAASPEDQRQQYAESRCAEPDPASPRARLLFVTVLVQPIHGHPLLLWLPMVATECGYRITTKRVCVLKSPASNRGKYMPADTGSPDWLRLSQETV